MPMKDLEKWEEEECYDMEAQESRDVNGQWCPLLQTNTATL